MAKQHKFQTTGPSLTQQQFKDEADINRITERYIPGMAIGNPNATRMFRFEDVSAIDFQEAQNVVAAARSAFEGLPSRIRDRFSNDPRYLLQFLEDARNIPEAIELGIIDPPPPPPPLPVGTKVPDEAPKSDPEANSHNGPKGP